MTDLENIDLCLYEINYWQRLLDEHIIWALIFQFHSPEGVWYQKAVFDVVIKHRVLRRAVGKNLKKNESQIKTMWQGEYKRVIKRVIYVIQYAMLAIQIAKYNSVIDKAEANLFIKEIKSIEFESYEQLKDYYKPKLDLLLVTFSAATSTYREFERDLEKKNGSYAMSLISSYGIDYLVKIYSIDYTIHQEFNDLIVLKKTKLSPLDSKVVSEINGMVYNYNTLVIICFPPSYLIYNKDTTNLLEYTYNYEDIFLAPTGEMIYLWKYNHSLHLSFKNSTIDSDQVKLIFWELYHAQHVEDYVSEGRTVVFLFNQEKQSLIYFLSTEHGEISDTSEGLELLENRFKNFEEIASDCHDRYSPFDCSGYFCFYGGGLLFFESEDHKMLKELIIDDIDLSWELKALSLISQNYSNNLFPESSNKQFYEYILTQYETLMYTLDENFKSIFLSPKRDRVNIIKGIELDKTFLFFMNQIITDDLIPARTIFALKDQRLKSERYLTNWWKTNFTKY